MELKDLEEAMAGLLKSPNLTNPESLDSKTLAKIYNETTRLLDTEPSSRQKNMMFESLGRSNPQEALRRLSISTSKVSLPGLADYQVALEGFAHRQDDSGMRKVIDLILTRSDLSSRGRVELVEIYVSFMLHRGGDDDFRVVDALLTDIQQEKLFPNDSILVNLIKACDQSGRKAAADAYAATLEQLLVTRKPPYDVKSTQLSCHALVAHAGHRGGFPAAEQKALQLRTRGLRLGTLTLNALIETDDCPVTDGQALLDLASQLDCQVRISTWSLLVLRATQDHTSKGIERALELYQFARRHSSGTDVNMVAPLVYAICLPSKGHASKEGLEQALEVYYDLRESRGTTPSDEPKPT